MGRGRLAMGFAGALVAGFGAAVAGPGTPERGGAAGAAGDRCELRRVERTTTPSQICMQCHQGGPASGNFFSMSVDGTGMGHAIGVDYEAARARRPGSYAPAHTLPPDVPLVNGRIECTTCHDGRSQLRFQIVDERRLCTACHIL